jgi:hypothetical protein
MGRTDAPLGSRLGGVMPGSLNIGRGQGRIFRQNSSLVVTSVQVALNGVDRDPGTSEDWLAAHDIGAGDNLPGRAAAILCCPDNAGAQRLKPDCLHEDDLIWLKITLP